MIARLAAIFVLVAATASAAVPTVKKASGDVRVGKPGAWRKAAQGTPIPEDEFLSVELGAHVTVQLADGSEKVLAGKMVISGKRLASAKTNEDRVLLSEQVRKQTWAALEFVPNSTAIAERGKEIGELGKRRRALSFMGEEEEEARVPSGPLDLAESRLRLGDATGAVDYAWMVVNDPDAPPLERCRAHLVMGRAAAADSDLDLAAREFDAAARPFPAWLPQELTFRSEALTQRGQMRMQLGDDAGARSDFEAAVALAPDSASAAQSNFFLGVLSLAREDSEGARRRFSALGHYPELARAAEELLHGDER